MIGPDNRALRCKALLQCQIALEKQKMSQRTKVVGTRTPMMWVVVFIAVILIAALILGSLVLLPQEQSRIAARERAAQVEQHYQAGLTFERVADWAAAEAEYRQAVAISAGYADVQARLADVKARQVELVTTATAVAIVEAGRAQAAASATAQAAQATVVAAPTVTAEALEARYQRALGLINLRQWVEAQAELRSVFDLDPNYRNVQEELSRANAEVAQLTPTATPTLISTATPTATPVPATIRLKPRRAVSFQNEGTRETDDTSLVGEQDGFWAPSLIGTVTQDYYANAWGEPFFDAVSLEFDVGERDYQSFDATLRVFIQHGGYGLVSGGDGRWNHYLALPGWQNPAYEDALPRDVAPAEQFGYTTGKWIEIALTPKFWSEDRILVTLRLWNARVDAIELLLSPRQR